LTIDAGLPQVSRSSKNKGKLGFFIKGTMDLNKDQTMRDMVFKNLTSPDKKKRVLWASETINENGILTKIHKYLIYIVKEIKKEEVKKTEKPEIYVTKFRCTKEKMEKFQIKMKGGIFCLTKEKYFYVSFCHTLKIDLCQAPQAL
jgi:hypothetical protein